MEGKEEKWREKLEQFKQDDRYDYLIELLLPYTAGLRAGSLDRGFLPILCEVEELLDKAREEGKLEVLEELLEPMWDTPPEWKFMRLKTKMAHMMRDLLKLKNNK